MRRPFRQPRFYYDGKQEQTLSVLDRLLQFTGLVIITGMMVWGFLSAIDKQQESAELAPANRAEVVARW